MAIRMRDALFAVQKRPKDIMNGTGKNLRKVRFDETVNREEEEQGMSTELIKEDNMSEELLPPVKCPSKKETAIC